MVKSHHNYAINVFPVSISVLNSTVYQKYINRVFS